MGVKSVKYLLTVFRHKWFVFLACLRVGGIPIWRVVIHDWSKFTLTEMLPYRRQFFGDKGDPAGFANALLHHWNLNPHHYQYWIDRPDHSGHYRKIFVEAGIIQDGCFEMPETYIREMIADWMGASRTYTGSWDMSDWLEQNFPKMKLHPATKKKVIEILGYSLWYKSLARKWGLSL